MRVSVVLTSHHKEAVLTVDVQHARTKEPWSNQLVTDIIEQQQQTDTGLGLVTAKRISKTD